MRERLPLEDGDFVDLDWCRQGSSKLFILSHGLEGDTSTQYIKGMAGEALRQGFDVLAWNYRGCSGEPNALLRFYHSGESHDLRQVIKYALGHTYESIVLIGFSVGGNITLKYLGQEGGQLDKHIKAAVAFSVPCDLHAGALHMSRWQNTLYMKRFLRSLRAKIRAKKSMYPHLLEDEGIHKIKTFYEFDTRYTAPLHGFASAEAYWKDSSSLYYLESIQCPTLLINALNDPFLPRECFPYLQAQKNKYLSLETPARGGHCGFYQKNSTGVYWSEQRAIEFIGNYL